MNPRSTVAIILALCVVMAFVSGSPVIKHLVGMESPSAVAPDVLAAWENILFAIIGALSGYIVGKDDDK